MSARIASITCVILSACATRLDFQVVDGSVGLDAIYSYDAAESGELDQREVLRDAEAPDQAETAALLPSVEFGAPPPWACARKWDECTKRLQFASFDATRLISMEFGRSPGGAFMLAMAHSDRRELVRFDEMLHQTTMITSVSSSTVRVGIIPTGARTLILELASASSATPGQIRFTEFTETLAAETTSGVVSERASGNKIAGSVAGARVIATYFDGTDIVFSDWPRSGSTWFEVGRAQFPPVQTTVFASARVPGDVYRVFANRRFGGEEELVVIVAEGSQLRETPIRGTRRGTITAIAAAVCLTHIAVAYVDIVDDRAELNLYEIGEFGERLTNITRESEPGPSPTRSVTMDCDFDGAIHIAGSVYASGAETTQYFYRSPTGVWHRELIATGNLLGSPIATSFDRLSRPLLVTLCQDGERLCIRGVNPFM